MMPTNSFRTASRLPLIVKKRNEAEKSDVSRNRNKRENRSLESSKGRKNHIWEDTDGYSKEERINKPVPVSAEEAYLSELFDKLLLCDEDEDKLPLLHEDESGLQPRVWFHGSRNHAKKMNKNEKPMVDLRNLLILCTEAVSEARDQ